MVQILRYRLWAVNRGELNKELHGPMEARRPARRRQIDDDAPRI